MDLEFLAINVENRQTFSQVPIEKRALFITHCLRKVDLCPYERKERGQGLACQACSDDCSINQILQLAEKKGYQNIFIVSGYTAVERLAEEFKPRAVVGIACPKELEEAIGKFEIPLQVVPLSEFDCELGSSVNLKEVKSILSL